MKKQGFIKGSAILLSSVVVAKSLGLAYKIPLTRLLGGSAMGHYSSAFSLFTPVIAIAAAGIPSAMARLTAENFALERFENVKKLKRTALVTFTLTGLVFTLLVLLCAMPVSQLLTGERKVGLAVCALAPSILICSVMAVYRGYYEGLRNMYPTAVSEVVETLFRLILGLAFAYGVRDHALQSFALKGECFGQKCSSLQQALGVSAVYETAAALLATSLSSLIACIYIMLASKLGGDGITMQMRQKDRITDSTGGIVRELFACCLPISLAALITTLTGMIDMLTVARGVSAAYQQQPQAFGELTDLGVSPKELPNFVYGSYTGLAFAVAGLVPTLTAMLGKSALAPVAEGAAKGNRYCVGRSMDKMFMLCSFIAFPSAVMLCVFPKQILTLLFSGRTAEIAASCPALRVLGIAVAAMSLSLPCFTLLQALGKGRRVTGIILLGGAIKLTGNLVLIRLPAFSLTGAAISTAVSETVICGVSLVSVYRASGARCSVKSAFVKPAYAAVLALMTAVISREILSKRVFIGFGEQSIALISIFLSGIMYLFSAVILCETPKSTIISSFCKKNRKNT